MIPPIIKPEASLSTDILVCFPVLQLTWPVHVSMNLQCVLSSLKGLAMTNNVPCKQFSRRDCESERDALPLETLQSFCWYHFLQLEDGLSQCNEFLEFFRRDLKRLQL